MAAIALSVRFTFLLWVLLFALPPGISGRLGDDGTGLLFRKRRDLLVYPIVKYAETIKYPRENIWKILQKQVPLNEPFPCEEATKKQQWRSDVRPESVHQLRPGDVDVIGAMGDSLTSGNGAREFNPLGVTIQDRGVSFTGGGIATWREFLTLPNIFKIFNANLVGYSLGRGEYGTYNAQLNVAIPASLDDDALMQAKTFVSKMLRDPRINFTSDWKVLSIYTGHNNLCYGYCYDEEKNSEEAHKFNLQRALDYLYENVPRIFVNIISILDVTIAARVDRSNFCKIMNRLLCSCLYHKGDLKKNLSQMTRIVQKYQDAEKELASSTRYDGREDFTVEWQPFFQFFNAPTKPDQQENKFLFRYLNKNTLWTPDCVHFNPRGMALWSTMLWNNMNEPFGNKSVIFQELSHRDVKCPTNEAPFLFTKKNSISYLAFGHQ